MASSNHRATGKVVRAVPSTQAPLVEQVTLILPLDQAGCYRAGVLPPKLPIPEKRINILHDHVRTKEVENIQVEIASLADEYSTSESALFLIAIEPSTGGTLFHTAISAHRLDILDPLRELFPPNMRFAIGEKALFNHKNHHGETILHLAVKTGRLDLVKAAFHLFNGDVSLEEEPDVENWTPDTELSDFLPALVFLLDKDGDGQDAATIASSKGYEDLAVWLDREVQKLDPEERRNDPTETKKWEQWMAGYHQHEYQEVPTQDSQEITT